LNDKGVPEAAAALTRDELVAEVAAMNRLHQLGARLLGKAGLQPLLEETLSATMDLQSAQMGCVHLYNPATAALERVAQRGFPQAFVDYFRVCDDGTTICGRALKQGGRVIVEDILRDEAFAPHQHVALSAGYRAVQSTPLFSRGGEPLGMISTYFRQPHRPSERELRLTDLYARQAADLIERERTEASLRGAHERVHLLLESLADNFFAFSKDWRFTYMNKHAEAQIRQLGMDPATIIGKIMWDVFPQVPNEAAIRRAMSERVAVTDELFYAPLGEWVENHIYPSPDGGIVFFQKYVTERKRTEEALRASEERFRRYFELGLVGMAITSPAKGCLEANDEMCRILGYDRGELLQKSWAEMTHPEDLAADVAQFDRVIAGKIDGYTLDKRWIRKDGRVIDSIVTAQCVRRADGSVDYFVGLVLDTTARKQSEEALHLAKLELAHVMRVTAMGELAASIAHEVNQPLAAIVANGSASARWLAAEPPNLHEAGVAIQRTIRDAIRASDIVAGIRTFLKRDESRTALDVNEVIGGVIDLTQAEIEKHEVVLESRPGVGLPPVMGDRVQLQQVTLNLVMNALEAMAPTTQRLRVLGIRTEAGDDGMVVISVRDSGVGLDPAHREQAFDAFHTTKPKGLGMGLAIGRSIVEAHGGRLWATANPDHGETFRFTLPVAPP
jgi:PAS domain S-box-containing protein